MDKDGNANLGDEETWGSMEWEVPWPLKEAAVSAISSGFP